MAWYLFAFIVGAALGGAGIGWAMWNKQAFIRKELARAKETAARYGMKL